MQVAVDSVRVITSRHGGEVVRIDGHHENERGELAKGYCFIDPRNDNWADWEETLVQLVMGQETYVLVAGVRMKNRARGLWNADSHPRVVGTVPRSSVTPVDLFTTLFDPHPNK